MKKNILPFALCWMSVSPFAWADTFGANNVGGILISNINMNVQTPVCLFDYGNIQKVVDFSNVTAAELVTETRTELLETTLRCGNRPANIRLTFVPVTGQPVENHPGVISSDLSGAGYRLNWANGSDIGVTGNPVDFNTPMNLTPTGVTNIKLNVTPVAISATQISGSAIARVNIVVNYT